MQTTCPQCSQGIIIDDAKIPDRSFAVRCPRCHSTIRVPGREAGAESADGSVRPSENVQARAAAPPPQPSPPQSSSPPEMPAALAPESLRDQYISPLHHESGEAQPRGRALVALSDGGQAGALTLVLTRVGFTVDAGGDGEEAARLIERGVYALVAMGKKGGAPDPGLFQRTIRLRPDARRRVFVLLVGEEFRSGDPLQAFTALADLVVQPRDLSACEGVLRTTLAERHRLYQAFLEARQRAEGGLAPQ